MDNTGNFSQTITDFSHQLEGLDKKVIKDFCQSFDTQFLSQTRSSITKVPSIGMKTILEKFKYQLVCSEEGSEVELPPFRLEVDSITLYQSVTIKGSPGSVLFVRGKGITVKGKRTGQIQIFESSIVFQSNKEESTNLVSLENDQMSLCLRDCLVASLNNETVDYCVQTVNSKAAIKISACEISGFSSVLKTEGSEIFIQNSHIYNTQASAIVAVNPNSILIQGCLIQHTQSCGVKAFLNQTVKLIEINQNCFYHNGKHAISITGGRVLNGVVNRNQIKSSSGKGIQILNTHFDNLQVCQNRVYWALETCCQLMVSVNQPIQIHKNEFLGSLNGFGLHLNCSSWVLKDSAIHENQMGGLKIESKYAQESTLQIINVSIANNSGSGITSELINRTVFVKNSVIQQNSYCGIDVEGSTNSYLYLQRSILQCNKTYGLYLISMPTFISQTKIIKNSVGALFLDELSKSQLVLTNGKKRHGNFIEGTIHKSIKSKSCCNNGRCQIF